MIVFTGILVGVETDFDLVSEYNTFFFTIDLVVNIFFYRDTNSLFPKMGQAT